MLCTQYAIRIAQFPDNPVYDDIFNLNYIDEYLAKPSFRGPFGFRVKQLIDEPIIMFDKDNIFKHQAIDTPWSFPRPEIDWSLSSFKKSETSTEVFISKFREIKCSYSGFNDIYTDGSKSGEFVAFAAFYPAKNFHLNGRLHPLSSIFSAELFAILQALFIIKHDPNKHFIIFSDSKSSLQALGQMDPTNPIVCSVLKLFAQMFKLNKVIKFCWIPSHCGIPGNEKVDSLAKEALTTESVNLEINQVVASDHSKVIRDRLKLNHQFDYFDNSEFNKLRQIQPDINYNADLGLFSRKHEMLITRLKIGHTYFTNGYLLRGEYAPFCDLCKCNITVKHILFECVEYEVQRRRFLNVPDYCDIFRKENYKNIIKFIESIGLYNFI